MFAVLPTGCRKSLIFQLVPKVCVYLLNQGFEYPKAAILVVVCPLSALIDSHIQELKDYGISAFHRKVSVRGQLCLQTICTYGQILPFVTTYHPAVKNLKQTLMEHWSLIQNQPLLKTMFKKLRSSLTKRENPLKTRL